MNEWTELFALLAAAGAALGVVGRLSQVGWRRGRRGYRYVQARLESLEDLPALAKLVRAELTTNGGGSMKDRVNELADASARHFKSVDEQLEAHEHRFEKVEFELRRKGGE